MGRPKERERKAPAPARDAASGAPETPPRVAPDVPEYRYAEILEGRRGEGPGRDTARNLTDEYVTEDADEEREGIDAVDNFTGATDAPDRSPPPPGEPGSLPPSERRS